MRCGDQSVRIQVVLKLRDAPRNERKSLMARVLACLMIGAVLTAVSGFGQSVAGESNSTPPLPRGLHIYNVSVYAGYSSLAYPLTGIATNYSSQIEGLGPDVNYGGSATIGWQRHSLNSNLSITYTGGYGGMVRYSDVNAISQSLAFAYSRSLSTRWTTNVSGAGQDQTMAQYLFEPARYSAITGSGASFDDFAAAFQIGQFSNAQIASMLTGAPILQSPARSLLLGNRILSYSVQAGLDFAYSSRLRFYLSSVSAAGQSRTDNSHFAVTQNYVMPRSTGLNGGGGFSYMLSPRTDFGVNGGEYMVWNRYQHARGTNATAFIGRKMGMHWFLRVYGGGSFTEMLQNSGAPPKTRQLTGGGSLGVKLYSHTLAASYDRSGYDSYGFAVGTNITATGSWHWQHPGSRWAAFASFGEQQLRNTGFASISGWDASGGIALQLRGDTGLTVGYTHLRSSGWYTGSFNEFSVDSIRLTLGWTPVQGSH